MQKINKISVTALVAIFLLSQVGSAVAATTVNLGTAGSFTVLAGSGITNTGPTTISGDVGTFPTTTETGFNSVTLSGANNVGNAVTQKAKKDLTTAYDNAAGQKPVTTVATELGGTTKIAGVYDSASGTFGITGTLKLDAQGDPSSVFIFKTDSTLITASSSKVSLINGAQACHVFWQVGSSATLGTNSSLKGSILALTSITLNTDATVEGRVLARNGAVALDTNTLTQGPCTASSGNGGSNSNSNSNNSSSSSSSSNSNTNSNINTNGNTNTNSNKKSNKKKHKKKHEKKHKKKHKEKKETPKVTPVPKLPNTGIAPEEESPFLGILAHWLTFLGL